ncbi:hypothetical protein [Thermoanaerobacterium sp. DL9XJH110]|uniref:hypothetical protein n=1 Tax=Thermoanaerobacterium sp. DL9XJH110 TaxID=3386643 RepID=UPI003BB77D38
MLKKVICVVMGGLMLLYFGAAALAGEERGVTAETNVITSAAANEDRDTSDNRTELYKLRAEVKEMAGDYHDYLKTLSPEDRQGIKDRLKDEFTRLKELREETGVLKEELKDKRRELKSLLPEAKKDESLKDDLRAIKVELKNLHDAGMRLRMAKLNLWKEFFKEMLDGKVAEAEETLKNVIHYKMLINANLKSAGELVGKAINLIRKAG